MKRFSVVLFWGVLLALARQGMELAQYRVSCDGVEIPFTFNRNEIEMRWKINGSPEYDFWFDTGADRTTIDLGFARELGLKLGAKHDVNQRGAGFAYVIHLPLLQANGFEIRNVDADAMDLKSLSFTGVNGVVGRKGIMDHRPVQIDYPKHVVRFCSKFPSDRNENLRGAANAVTMPLGADLITKSVFVNGVQIKASFDTGFDGGFYATARLASKLGLQSIRSGAITLSGATGVNGITRTVTKSIGEVTVGTIHVSNPPVTYPISDSGNPEWDIHIGNGFLKDYVVTFDFEHKVVVLSRP